MSQRIINPETFGKPNFKPSIKDRLKKEPVAQHERAGNSEAHLALLRQMPCCITLKMPGGEAHHLKQGTGERGTGMRSTDRWALPISHGPHMELEKQGSRNEQAWFAKHGIPDPLGLANALWHGTGDLPRMIRILMAHRER
jgi:hypothetical protein